MNTKNILRVAKFVSDSTDVIIGRNEKIGEIIEGDFFEDRDELDDTNFEKYRAELVEHINVIQAELKNLYKLIGNETDLK